MSEYGVTIDSELQNKASYGIVYLGGEELRVLVKTISLTGLIVDLENKLLTDDIYDMFQLLANSETTIDIFLPETQLTGEVQVLKIKKIDKALSIEFEFSQISYDTDNLLHRRHSYRENLKSLGTLVLNRKQYPFQTKNASIDGLMIHINEYVPIDKDNDIAIFSIKNLRLKGQCKIVWVEYKGNNQSFIGLQYIHLEKDENQAIPRTLSAYL